MKETSDESGEILSKVRDKNVDKINENSLIKEQLYHQWTTKYLKWSLALFISSVIVNWMFLSNLSSLPNNISADKSFPSPYGMQVDGNMLGFLLTLGLVFTLTFAAFPKLLTKFSTGKVVSFLFISILLFMAFLITIENSIRGPVYDKLILAQHDWSKERYGLVYDEIIIKTEGYGRDTYSVQGNVIYDGIAVASVCEDQNDPANSIIFCTTGTNQELPLLKE